MAEHAMTKRCRIAVARAEKALEKALERLADAQRAYNDAEADLLQARYDLSINERLDAQRPIKLRQGAR